jgi:hypothetical protein
MSDPLNDFSQPDADLQPDGDMLGSDDEEQVDENGDKVESDDTGVSLRDVAEGEQRASWG